MHQKNENKLNENGHGKSKNRRSKGKESNISEINDNKEALNSSNSSYKNLRDD